MWNLLPIIPSHREYNKIAVAIIHYLTHASTHSTIQHRIERDLSHLFKEFILNHLSFNEEDLEEFDCNEEAFVKMDLEEHDKETRRRACFELIEKLSQTFPDKVGSLVQDCQAAYMEEYL